MVPANIIVANPERDFLSTWTMRPFCAAVTAAVGVLWLRSLRSELPHPLLVWVWPVGAALSGMFALAILRWQLIRRPYIRSRRDDRSAA